MSLLLLSLQSKPCVTKLQIENIDYFDADDPQSRRLKGINRPFQAKRITKTVPHTYDKQSIIISSIMASTRALLSVTALFQLWGDKTAHGILWQYKKLF